MDVNYQPKRAHRGAWNPDITKNKWIAAAAAAVVIVVIAIILLSGPKDPDAGREEGSDGVTIGNTYCPIQISEEKKDNIRYEMIREGDVVQVVFYSLPAETEKELFRIYFGDGGRGDTVGRMQTEDGIVPISVAAVSYEMQDFSSEEELQQHYALMEEVNVVLESIRGGDNFVDAHQKQTMELDYWTVELPVGITCEEKTKAGIYRADFYTVLGGEKQFLYTIYVGNEEEGTLLGTYTQDGAEKSVSVVPNPMAGQIAAENVEFAVMMDTVNDVIQVIVSSQGFVRNSSK